MNIIFYENDKGEQKSVKTERAYKYLDDRRVSWKRKVNARTTRRPTMAEADAAMLKDGFKRRAHR